MPIMETILLWLDSLRLRDKTLEENNK